MKYLFGILVLALLILCMCACPKSSDSSAVVTSSELSSDEDAALYYAQRVIKDKVSYNVTFENGKQQIEETSTSGRFKILQPYTYNHQEFIYKVYVQQYESEWYYGNLQIEERNSGVNVLFEKGNLKAKEQAEINKEVNCSSSEGVKYTVKFKNEDVHVISILTDGKLSKEQVKSIFHDLSSSYSTINVFDKNDNSDKDYVTLLGNTVFDFYTNTGDDYGVKLEEW